MTDIHIIMYNDIGVTELPIIVGIFNGTQDLFFFLKVGTSLNFYT